MPSERARAARRRIVGIGARAMVLCACASRATTLEDAREMEDYFYDASETLADARASASSAESAVEVSSEARARVWRRGTSWRRGDASALASAQPRSEVSEDALHVVLERATRDMELESRGGSFGARARAFARASRLLATTMWRGKSLDLTSFLGTPIRWCARASVLRTVTDSESSLGADATPRTIRFFDAARRARDAPSRKERCARVALALIADSEPPASLRKPLNPILGETAMHSVVFPGTDERFSGIWEQVTHHPPVSANFASGAGLSVAGEVRPRPHLVGAHIEVALEGYLNVTLDDLAETYECDLADFEWRFLPRWHARMKRDVTWRVRCAQTGYRAEFAYGSNRSIKGAVYGPSDAHECDISGRYDGKVVVTSRDSGNVVAAYDFAETKCVQAHIVRHTIMTDEYDTEVVWRDCFAAMEAKKWEEARIAKHRVEEREREKRRRGERFTPRFFTRDERSGRWVRNNRHRGTVAA